MRDGLGAGRIGGDHGADAARLEMVSEGVRIERRIADYDLGGQPLDERFGLCHLVRLAGGEANAQGVAQAIRGDVQLGAQAPARAPDGLILSPPFAPAEC